MGFMRGFLAPFRGAVYLVRHRMWAHLLLPIVIGSALAGAAAVLAIRYWRAEPWLADLLGSNPVLGWIALVVFTGLGAVVLFLVSQPLLLAVFVDLLSEKVERQVSGTAPHAPLLASIGRSLVHGLLKLVLYGFALVVGLALTALTGIGSLVGVALGGLFLAYDGFDYPLARRNAGFGAKWGYLLRHPALTVGYATGATLFYLIPLALFVAPSVTAVGATLAFLEEERRQDRVKERAKEAAQAGEKTGAQTGAKTGAKTGVKTGNETGAKTGNKTGNETGNEPSKPAGNDAANT